MKTRITGHERAARWFLRLALAALTSVGFASSGAAAEVDGPMTWGGLSNVTRYQNLYFSGQPDLAALEAARRAGIQLVINLRAPGEMTWNEAASVRELGMRYANVPLSGRSFDPDAIAKIESLVANSAGTPILIHCTSSNRAGGWLVTHLITREGRPFDAALELGRRAGLDRGFVVETVRAYLAALDP